MLVTNYINLYISTLYPIPITLPKIFFKLHCVLLTLLLIFCQKKTLLLFFILFLNIILVGQKMSNDI
jgi:hypothetical protein